MNKAESLKLRQPGLYVLRDQHLSISALRVNGKIIGVLNSSDRLESNASLTFTYLNGTSNTVKLAIEETSGQKTSLLISKDEDGEIIITASGLKFVEHVEVFPWDDLEDEKKKETTRAVNMAISENYPSLREDHGKRTKGKKLKELTWGEARNIYDAITSTIPQEA